MFKQEKFLVLLNEFLFFFKYKNLIKLKNIYRAFTFFGKSFRYFTF